MYSVPLFSKAIDILKMAHELQIDGEPERSLELCMQSIQTCPTAEAYAYLANRYAHERNFEKAIETCKTAIMLEPSHGHLYNDLAVYLFELERYDEALDSLLKSIDEGIHNPERFRAYYNLGKVFLKQSYMKDAQKAFTKSLTLNPTFQPAQIALNSLDSILL